MNSDGLTAEECAQRAAELLAVYRTKRDEAKRTNRRDPEKQRLVEEAHRIALEIEAWMKEYRRKLKERVT